jgi:hypothetical protein
MLAFLPREEKKLPVTLAPAERGTVSGDCDPIVVVE